ncbi:MAG: glycoside hydrolase family 127 protein [Verrucomicrobia bacterium]|nr:glycoside hydrolase family 127 protein [Verrucomicrobiota bacterium]
MKAFSLHLLGVALLGGVAASAAPRDYPVTPVPFTAVRVQDEFWSPRLETNRVTTVWYDFKKCEETGRIDNFAKAGGLMKGEFKGIPFDDSDVYKVIEGAAYALSLHPDPKLAQYLDDLIAKIAAAQEPDGYLYTARRLFPPEKMPGMSGKTRWSSLVGSHELYNVGHLYEAAVAHFQATGKRTLLAVATKNADFLCATFGPGKVQYPPGHQEIEIGLAKLYRVTGQEKYLKLAKYFLDIRGRPETHKLYGPNQQDHQPVTEQAEAVGHSVRAGYMYAGMADVAALTGEAAYIRAIDRIWENVVSKKIYLTGGIGARHSGEAFGENYELPNASAYNETCAAIASALWNHRMFLLHGDARYLDVLERTIYNGFLSGVSLTGDRFFYPNPLASGKGYQRSAWFGCSCCPVNVVRFVPSIAGYIYATRGDELFVNLFIGGSAKAQVGGASVELKQHTRYPWDGKVVLTLAPEKESVFTLNLRIPGWARNEVLPSDLYRYDDGLRPEVKLAVNGSPAPLSLARGFAQIQRAWKAGDTVTLDLPMPVRRVVANEAVKDDQFKFAIERGPIVYCAEGTDNPGRLISRVVNPDVRFETRERPDLLNGVVTLKMMPKEGEALTLIPNYAWCNRGPNEMTVWFRTRAEPWSASHCWDADSVEACFDGKLPKSSSDQRIPRLTFWDHKGTTEWVERGFEKTTTVSTAEVYWFDDTGRGGCRVPQSWRLLYQDDDNWKPVEAAGEYSTKLDQFNAVNFKPVTTTALRLEVKLQPSFSGGVLEWRVK